MYGEVLRRNRRIGHYNRTGNKWNNHFDIWLLDEIVETAIQLDMKPTFPEPKLLANRIATSEMFGIIPITPQLAKAMKSPSFPLPTFLQHPTTTIHNYRFALTQFSTKPVNLYRYIQLRQWSIAAVDNISSFIPLNATAMPEKIYKLPEQLERHLKKSIQWKTTRATLNMGENVAALEPIHELVRDPLRKAVVLPAITHEPVEVNYAADPLVGVDLSSFNPTAMRQQLRAQRAVYTASAAIPSLEPAPVQPEEQPLAQPEVQQTILAFAPTEHDGDYELMEVERPTKKARAAVQQADPGKKRAERRCALCAHAKCGQELTCKGKGGREKCGYKNQPSHGELGFDVATRKRHHRTRGS
ncbi:hypothetical protein GGX14DRAFT_577110 [Mycena pura]|uniref:Uncharacterized protein n=1 Tax=Mycena pura TaxID=153505 RepID=A0AAD6UVT6_9AGAR|nr:hypothetical protein GGX14DRAFT_577110 [Mycena pura]